MFETKSKIFFTIVQCMNVLAEALNKLLSFTIIFILSSKWSALLELVTILGYGLCEFF